MRKYFFYTLLFCLATFVSISQVVFLNNPSNHIVFYNPAFSAIKNGYNKNYIGNQACVSSRIAKSQSDVLGTAQYFFDKKNVGISVHYNNVQQKNSSYQKAGIGLSYQLLFFNEITTGWAVSLNYNDFKTDTANLFSIYNENYTIHMQASKKAIVNFGWMINYENNIAGISYQPKQLVYSLSNPSGTYQSATSFYLKHRKSVTRNVSATLWYSGYFTTVNNLVNAQSELVNKKIQNHAFNVHFSGKKGLIGGVGFRFTNFNYQSFLCKLGFNYKQFQILYGIEPYWLKQKYSETIQEISITYRIKTNI